MGQSVGISKSELIGSYYYDEFIAMMDEYNDMHRYEKDDEEEIYADEF